MEAKSPEPLRDLYYLCFPDIGAAPGFGSSPDRGMPQAMSRTCISAVFFLYLSCFLPHYIHVDAHLAAPSDQYVLAARRLKGR